MEPDVGFSWAYALVNGAHTSLDMTMYELVDTTFSDDLVAACGRGVHVRVILDGVLERSHNTPAYEQLNAAPNCAAVWSNPQFQATHQKSFIVDGGTLAILSGNLTSRYYTTTRDFALVENDPADIAAVEATFAQDYGSTTDIAYAPGAGDDLIWSPTTAEPDLLGLIAHAQTTLLVENEELGATSIEDALKQACGRGVAVHLAMTNTSAAYQANYAALEAAGCGVHVGADNATTLYIHAKTILADAGTANAKGYLGSINFSNASLTENRELGLYVSDPALLQTLAKTVSADYAQFPPP